MNFCPYDLLPCSYFGACRLRVVYSLFGGISGWRVCSRFRKDNVVDVRLSNVGCFKDSCLNHFPNCSQSCLIRLGNYYDI